MNHQSGKNNDQAAKTDQDIIENEISLIAENIKLNERRCDEIKSCAEDLDNIARRGRLSLLEDLNLTDTASFESISQKKVTLIENQLIPAISALWSRVREYPYYQFRHLWRSEIQQAIGTSLLYLLINQKDLPTSSDISMLIHVEFTSISLDHGSSAPKYLYVTYEDYLYAVVSIVNELPMILLNAVSTYLASNSDENDQKIALAKAVKCIIEFVSQGLRHGQRLLTSLDLKNDGLRRKIDGVKYSANKIDEILYDLRLRGVMKEIDDKCYSRNSETFGRIGL